MTPAGPTEPDWKLCLILPSWQCLWTSFQNVHSNLLFIIRCLRFISVTKNVKTSRLCCYAVTAWTGITVELWPLAPHLNPGNSCELCFKNCQCYRVFQHACFPWEGSKCAHVFTFSKLSHHSCAELLYANDWLIWFYSIILKPYEFCKDCYSYLCEVRF